MKRGIAAIIIVLFCIVFATTVNLTLENKAQSLCYLAEQTASNRDCIYSLEKEWRKQLIYFELFADHSLFESIDQKINRLFYLEDEFFYNTCIETVFELITLKEHLAFSLANIL